MKIGRITQLTMEPLQCSQGGVPFNKPHLDAATAEIDCLRARVAELEAELNEPVQLSEWQKLTAERDGLRHLLNIVLEITGVDDYGHNIAYIPDEVLWKMRTALEDKT